MKEKELSQEVKELVLAAIKDTEKEAEIKTIVEQSKTEAELLEKLRDLYIITFKIKFKDVLEQTGVNLEPNEDEKPTPTHRNNNHQQSEPELTPEEEVEEFMRGERGFGDLSSEAETWFFEEVDDD